MISNFVKFELSDPEKGNVNLKKTHKTLTFRYPCSNTTICTPYKLTLSPGAYQFECWGSKGVSSHPPAYPGKGAYTKGSIAFFKKTEVYVYIGATGQFNMHGNESIKPFGIHAPGGGSTDVRLEYSDVWHEERSLRSRIMVAAGGGGVEWKHGIGGNGGELEGEPSTSYTFGEVKIEQRCNGSTQTGGSTCPEYENYGSPHPGTFGSAGIISATALSSGGLGGGGYYGGTSYDYAYAGSGGSSFISGHDGCKAITRNEETIEHSSESFHYSGYVFYKTEMIAGNKTMPLPSGRYGVWDENNGAFRLTLIAFHRQTLRCKRHQSLLNLLLMIIIINK